MLVRKRVPDPPAVYNVLTGHLQDHAKVLEDADNGFSPNGRIRSGVQLKRFEATMTSDPKVILISGASSGIGEAAARHLASLGHSVVLGARRVDRIEAIAQEIDATGGTALALPLDVVSRHAFHAFVTAAYQRFGRIDVLINNAGVMPLSMVADLRVEEWDQMIDVNIRGVLYGIAAAMPIFQQQKSGHVINVGSVAGHRVDPTAAVYCATKYAVRALSDGLRQESRDIRVTLVSPGLTRTELLDTINVPDTRAFLQDLSDQVAIPASAIAEVIAYAISQPATVDVNELIVRPTAQG